MNTAEVIELQAEKRADFKEGGLHVYYYYNGYWAWLWIFLLSVILIAFLPVWPHSRRRRWDYYPSGITAFIIIIYLLLLFFAVI